uniref:Uncharacterized protein n=2 Tax=unclassified bacterial viruses TaxID=12333 RepID=A0AAU6VZ17_9VIRU
MGSMNPVLLSLGSVKAYRGYAVVRGVVQLTDNDVIDYLNSNYEEVVICNFNVKPGGALLQLAPIMFAGVKSSLHEELQHSLQGQLASGNDVDIDWHG